MSGRRTTFPRTSGFVDSVVDVDRVNSSFKLSFESSWRSFKATLLTTAFVACDSAKEMFDKTAIRPVINLLLSNCRCGLWKEAYLKTVKFISSLLKSVAFLHSSSKFIGYREKYDLNNT